MKTPSHSIHIRERKLKNGNISLYFDIYLGNGKRQYESLDIKFNPKNKTDRKNKYYIANEIKLKRDLEIINNDNGIIPYYKKKSNFVEYFEKLCKNKSNTENSWNNTLKKLKEFTKGNIAINNIDEIWLEEFKKHLLTKVSNNTANTYFSKIKACLSQAVKDKLINSNPSQNVKQIPIIDIERVYLTNDELKMLSKTDCQHNSVKLAFLFACNTGLRLSDIKKLTWENILFDENKIVTSQKKTKESLYLPLNQNAIEILEGIKNNKIQGFTVFELPCNTLIREHLKIWTARANINKHVTFHTSRHTFATISLTYGTDLYTVSKLLGHKKIQSTQIYAKIVDEKMKEAVNKLPKIDIS